MLIELTEAQQVFIKFACNLKGAIFPFEEIEDDRFLDDFGISKEDMQSEIENLHREIIINQTI